MGLAGQEGQKAGVHSQWEGSARGQGRGQPPWIWPQRVTGRGASEHLRGREPVGGGGEVRLVAKGRCRVLSREGGPPAIFAGAFAREGRSVATTSVSP